MISSFVPGETYSHPDQEHNIMVFGIGNMASGEVTLAVLYVDKGTHRSLDFGELTVKMTDEELEKWNLVDYTNV